MKDETTKIAALTEKIKSLPWKQIAIGTAAAAAGVAVVKLTKVLDKTPQEDEVAVITDAAEV